MKERFINPLFILVIMTVLTGLIYPLTITGIAQLIFPHKSNGSLISSENKILGSELIGQQFDSSIYFWPRPSAIDYNPLPSSGSNLGPASNKLKTQAEERIRLLLKEHPVVHQRDIPAEMIFASASGLDPHISPEAARMQVGRITLARGLDEDQRQKLIQLMDDMSEGPQFLVFGQPRINVFKLNLALDSLN